MKDSVYLQLSTLLFAEKELKGTIYQQQDGAILEGQILKDAVSRYWSLLPHNIQETYEYDLLNNASNSKVTKFAKDINRSLNGLKDNSLDALVSNFEKVELPNHANQQYPFLSTDFGKILTSTCPLKGKERYFAGNIQTQLAGFSSNRADTAKLFEVTAYLINGLVTNKFGHSRTTDNSLLNDLGQIRDENLVIEVAKFADQNLDILSTQDPKTLKFIGTSLKNAYKNITDTKGLSQAFADINIQHQINLHEAQKRANTLVSRLTGPFNRASDDADLLKLDNKLKSPQNKARTI